MTVVVLLLLLLPLLLLLLLLLEVREPVAPTSALTSAARARVVRSKGRHARYPRRARNAAWALGEKSYFLGKND